jgi:rod shape-determining protein MreC
MISGSNGRVWLVLAAVLFGHTLLVASPVANSPRTGLVRTLVLDGLTPIEKAFDMTVNGIGSLWSNYFDLLDTRRENQRLQDEIAELQMVMDRTSEEVREAARLRRLLDLAPLVNAERVVARVIGRDTSTARQTVTIDKGSNHGLYNNAPVVTPEGIVGRVIHTGHYSAIVQLVSDAESGVGVIAAASRIQGIVRGDGSRFLELEHVDDHRELSPGEWIVTSGTDQIYPKGLPLGTIAASGPDRGLMKTARVEPAADLGRLEEVLCLIPVEGTTFLHEEFQEDVLAN